MTTGQLPAGRYGPDRTGHRSRRARLLGTTLAVLVGLAVAALGYHNLARTPVEGQALGFTLLTDQPDGHAVSLRFEVVRDDPARPAVCIVRARSRDGDETGRKEVYVPPAAGPTEITTVIRTSRPPVMADVYGCSLKVPVYLSPDPDGKSQRPR